MCSLWIFLSALTEALPQGVLGQGILNQGNRGEQVTEGASDTVWERIVPIPGTRITEAFNDAFNLVKSAGKKQLTGEEIRDFSDRIDTLFSMTDPFLADTIFRDFQGVTIRELDYIHDRADYYLDQVADLQWRLSGESGQVSGASSQLSALRRRWQLTLENQEREEVPPERLTRIVRIIHQMDSVRQLLQQDLGIILHLQDRLADKRIALETLQENVREKQETLGRNLFSADMPGFFRELSQLGDKSLAGRHLEQVWRSLDTDWQVFRSDYSVPMVVIGLLFIVLLVFSIWFKRHFARLVDVEKFDFSGMHMVIIYSPVATVVFLTALLIRFVLPDLPGTFMGLNMIILMVPLLILVIRLFGSLVRSWMIVLVVIYSLTFVYERVYYPDIFVRSILLGFSVAGLMLFIWMIRRRPLASRFSNMSVYRAFRVVLGGFALLLLIAIFGNLAGAIRMAEFFTLVPIQVAVLAIGIQITIRVADTLIFLAMASNSLQKLNLVREEFRVIHKKSVWLIGFILWIFFITQVLDLFRVKEAFFDWGHRVLTTGRKIGEVDITPGSILIFIFMIWFSIYITRIIRRILEKDVFARVAVSRGMPSTIILLVRVVLITGGFFLAAAAAGMELTNLSIVLGAFSVGIGFGLQNIFNNMVSGLILAFERPIKVGDTVQVGDLLGVVLSIGLRSSTVRSFDGAEVIVPNGNLISDQMINWTLSDSTRRMDIRVGVAYGTDPQRVLDILLEAAKEHRRVDKQPPPRGFFLGFGDSSLDFRLLAWVEVEFRLETESELYVAIYRKLNEAGIEIPFPQRDLHIRSDFREKGEE